MTDKSPTYGGSLDFGYCSEPDNKVKDRGGNRGQGDEVLRQDTRSNHVSSNYPMTVDNKVKQPGTPGPGNEGQTLRGYVSNDPAPGVTLQDGNSSPTGRRMQQIQGPIGDGSAPAESFPTPNRRGSPGD